MGRLSKGRCLVALIALTLPLASAAQIGKAPQVRIFETYWPAASDGFEPRDTFPMHKDAVRQAWASNGIDTVSADQDAGLYELIERSSK